MNYLKNNGNFSIPENGKRGGQWKDHRQILNGIF